MSICPKCGQQNRSEAQFCNKCGASLIQRAPATQPGQSGVKAPFQDPNAQQKPAPESPPAPDMQSRPPKEPGPSPENLPASVVDTQPLVPLPPTFAALPPGELIDNRRYEVISVINRGENINAYLVQDRQHRRCTQCGSTANRVDAEFCQDCGFSFASEEPIQHPSYLLRETLDREILAQEALIAELGLRHPGMVNIYRAFEYSPYADQTRFYLLSDANEGDSLKRLPHPQPEEVVLTWGKQLAEALAYLHKHNIRHRRIRLENIRLVDSQARLTNFGLAEKAPRGTPQEWFAEDVQALIQVLHDLLAGQTLSPSVAAIFSKAFSPHESERYSTAEALLADLSAALDVLQRPDSVNLLVGRCSDPGQVRELNEDSLLTLEIMQVLQSVSKPIGLYAVADGMGGHSAGEVASALAISTLAYSILSSVLLPIARKSQADPAAISDADLNYSELLREACQKANHAVYEQGRITRSDMGTTLVAALVVGSEAYVANIGDSRAYHVNQTGIRQITTDHSLVERLVATGQITREQARTHPERNVIYRTVGDKPQVEVDLFHQGLSRGDWLVLCSDGLSGLVEDEEIHRVVRSSLHPQEACEELVRLANLAGGDDNITVIAVKVVESR